MGSHETNHARIVTQIDLTIKGSGTHLPDLKTAAHVKKMVFSTIA